MKKSALVLAFEGMLAKQVSDKSDQKKADQSTHDAQHPQLGGGKGGSTWSGTGTGGGGGREVRWDGIEEGLTVDDLIATSVYGDHCSAGAEATLLMDDAGRYLQRNLLSLDMMDVDSQGG